MQINGRRTVPVSAVPGVRMHSEQVAVVEVGDGLESAAREARYKVFEKQLAEEVLLGHHADDQVETYSIGCCGAPGGWRDSPYRIGGGNLLRPLLPWPKAALQAFAEAGELRWIEDESNRSCSLIATTCATGLFRPGGALARLYSGN